MTVKQGLNSGRERGTCQGQQRLNLPSHGKHMQDILSWETGREQMDLPQGGFPCCRWRRCWAWQRDRAQVAKLPEPPRPCSTRQVHGGSLAGAQLQSSCVRTAWARRGLVSHSGATAGMGNARMPSEQARGTKAVTALFSKFSSARWACNTKAKTSAL